MSVYKYQGDRENIDVTKMIALNSHCNSGNTQKLLQIYRLQTAIFITKLGLVPG